ncbi:MAG: hypothetical protein ACLFUX_00825 [Spirochaetaceae bacterium]
MTRTIGPILVLAAMVASLGFGQNQVHGTVESLLVVQPSDTDGLSAHLRPEDLAALSIDQEMDFLRGIQLEIRLPEAIRENRGEFGVYLYDGVAPSPREGRQAQYGGRRILFHPLPSASRLFVTIPVHQNHGLRETADAVLLDEVIRPERFPVLVTFMPVMKGVSSEAMQTTLRITAKPLVFDVGAVRLRLYDPDGTDVLDTAGVLDELTLLLDDEEIEYGDEPIVVPPGLHRLVLESPRFENERVTFGVERGSVAEVEIELTEPQSEISFEAPEGAALFIDGEEVDYRNEEVSLSEGDHTVMFRIGDYSVSRSFTVDPKKSYKISLKLDILIDKD